MATSWAVGDRVSWGEGEDHDHGRVEAVDGCWITVAWDTLVKTVTHMSQLDAEDPECSECAALETTRPG